MMTQNQRRITTLTAESAEGAERRRAASASTEIGHRDTEPLS